MILSLNNSNIKYKGIDVTYGSSIDEMIQFSKGDKIALKRFHFKLASHNRYMFLGGFGLKQFKLFIKYVDNITMDYQEELFHTFTYSIDDDSYTFEVNKDDVIFQECSFEKCSVFSFKVYGIMDEPTKYVPIIIDEDESKFELELMIQKTNT